MKAAFIMHSVSRNAGGLFEACRRLAHTLQAGGDKVVVFGVDDERSQEDAAAWAPVRLSISMPRLLRSLGYAPGLAPSLADFAPDILHTHGLWNYPSFVAAQWRGRSRKPEVIHAHGMLDPWALQNSRWKKRLVLRLFERSHLKNANCIRALCLSELESIRAFRLHNPVCVIPNGIDLPLLSLNEPRVPRPQKKILLYLGRIHPKKGLVNLMTAWANLLLRKGDAAGWTLAVAGWDQDGHEDILKRQATGLGVAWKDIRDVPAEPGSLERFLTNPSPLMFLGPQFGVQKEQIYRACDAFVLPSFSEGLPMVVLEAWAYSKPVLMTPMCNIPEGFAADAAIKIEPTVGSIEEGLERLTRLSDQEREATGQRGRRLVEDRFSWEEVGARMIEVNEWLVHGGEKPSCVFL
jgi:glycosyltransferase involved in cell wall biosynthesis